MESSRRLDADERTDFGGRRGRAGLYWAADFGSVAGSGGDGSLSFTEMIAAGALSFAGIASAALDVEFS